MRKPRLSLVATAPRKGDAAIVGKPGMYRMPMLVPAVAPLVQQSPPPRETSWRDLVRRLTKKLVKR